MPVIQYSYRPDARRGLAHNVNKYLSGFYIWGDMSDHTRSSRCKIKSACSIFYILVVFYWLWFYYRWSLLSDTLYIITHCTEPHQPTCWSILLNNSCCCAAPCGALFTWVVYESSSVFVESHTKGFLPFTYTMGPPMWQQKPFQTPLKRPCGVQTRHRCSPLPFLQVCFV